MLRGFRIIGRFTPWRRDPRAGSSRVLSGNAGMTLLELLVASSIMILLATVAIPMARVTIIRGRERELHLRLREIRDAIDRYNDAAAKGLFQVQAGTENYPPDLDTLYNGVTLTGAGAQGGQLLGQSLLGQAAPAGQSQPVSTRLRFLREIPIDPMTNSKDWGLRSVQDDPDTTSWGGQDVFDVYSKSTGTALDGTKYSDW
jgi:general secretion pathway protein G